MDATDDLMMSYKDLFNAANDIVHPLRANTGLVFDITAPLSSEYGILSKFDIPSNALVPVESRTAASKMQRVAEGGAYFSRRTVDGLSSSRLLVTAATASNGISTASADLKSAGPGRSFGVRGVLHVPITASTEAGVSLDVQRRDYAASLKLATTGTVYGAYHQLIGAFPALAGLRLSAAAEVMVADLFPSPLTTHRSPFPLKRKGPSAEPGLSYAATLAAETADRRHLGVASCTQIRMGLPKVEAVYVHSPSKHTSIVAAAEYNHLTAESKTSVGYRTRFPRTRSTFTASLTSDGGVRGCFERALLSNVRASVALDSVIFAKPPRAGQEVAASVRLSIGPQPRPPLELTPILLRDGPRVWQK